MTVVNPFGSSDAERYARARPRYQSQALDAGMRILGLERPVARALDVGCGTGHSSSALKARARFVVAVDVAPAMLAAAERSGGVAYAAAVGERLPVRAGVVDLVTAGAVFHWLDGARFLAEARRVLRPGGGLLSYSDFFTGEVRGAPGVAGWLRETYLPRHPAPPRRPPLSSELAAGHGFEIVGSARLHLEFAMTVEEFTDYLLTQSNALAAVSSGVLDPDGLREEVRPLFPCEGTGTAVFGAKVTALLRRTAAPSTEGPP